MSRDEDTSIADVLFDARLLSSMIEACEDRTQLMLSSSFWSVAAELSCSIKTLDDLSEPRVIKSACPGAGLKNFLNNLDVPMGCAEVYKAQCNAVTSDTLTVVREIGDSVSFRIDSESEDSAEVFLNREKALWLARNILQMFGEYRGEGDQYYGVSTRGES